MEGTALAENKRMIFIRLKNHIGIMFQDTFLDILVALGLFFLFGRKTIKFSSFLVIFIIFWWLYYQKFSTRSCLTLIWKKVE